MPAAYQLSMFYINFNSGTAYVVIKTPVEVFMGNMYVLDKRLACCSLVIFIVLIAGSTNVVQGKLASYVL